MNELFDWIKRITGSVGIATSFCAGSGAIAGYFIDLTAAAYAAQDYVFAGAFAGVIASCVVIAFWGLLLSFAYLTDSL